MTTSILLAVQPPRHSPLSGWSCAVLQHEMHNGIVSAGEVVAQLSGCDSAEQALTGAKAAKDRIEAERIEADRYLGASKFARFDRAALELQIQREGHWL